MGALISLVISFALAYLPVALAWMNGYEVVGQTNRLQRTVELNMFMKLSPSIYMPLLKWHAERFGWRCAEVHGLGTSTCIVIFFRVAD